MTAVKKIKKEERYTYEDYKNWKDSEDWEIIGGKAYSMAPSPMRKHQDIARKLLIKIGNYLEGKPCKVYYELDVVLSEEDVVKPDIIVVCDKNKLKERNVEGSPDLTIEILSPSTSKRDKGIKYELYKKFGVKEYLIVDPYNLIIEVHNFEKATMVNYFYDEELSENLLEVGIFGGELKIDVNYVFDDNF